MARHWSSEDLIALGEGCDLECKAAQGRDGRGEVPEDFWRSYSAMANADGGVILLGVQEKPRGQFKAIGLADLERVRKALWDNLHNRKQVSANLLAEDDVRPVQVDDKMVLHVRVRRATRQQRPVHVGSNPFGGTWLRRHEGDYAADDEAVRRMMAERVEDSRDERVLRNFDLADLDMESVAAFRNRFASVKPGHVWAELSTPEFLKQIGAWGKNREEGHEGLRIAGLLMFGRAEVIRDALPHYMVDFQEQPEARTEQRWIDRLVPDGTWSGNLYDFFRRVYQKLTVDLKVPFQLKNGQRLDDTPVHEALREALAKTLIHADYSGRVSVLIIKRPDMFGFRNPGRMRIPPEIAIQGGNSDCRNRRLQIMFQLVGYGDNAGSGLPKIYTNWAGQHWRRPVLHELPEPEQTLMELRTSSLVPAEAVADLDDHLGERFRMLPETARLALITAWVEGIVSHDRLKQICIDHPADLTKTLGVLVRDGLLSPSGSGRGMVYVLPWQQQASAVAFGATDRTGAITEHISITPVFDGITPVTPELASITPEFEQTDVSASIQPVLDWSLLPVAGQNELLEIVRPISGRGRISPSTLQSVIRALCMKRHLGLRVLAHVLQRNPDHLRKRTLAPMVKAGLLRTSYVSPRDPRQAYTTVLEHTGDRISE